MSSETKSDGGWVTREVSLGHVLSLLGMLSAIGAGIWQGGMIRATLEDSISAEREMRRVESVALAGRIDGLTVDVRELRTELHVAGRRQGL